MRSYIFHSTVSLEVEAKIANLLNSHASFLTAQTMNSPRAVGDAIQDIISQQFGTIIAAYATQYSAIFARRAMADLAFEGIDGNYYVVDVKTHRADTHFNMPNLTSAERLVRFYEDDRNYFALLLVRYKVLETGLHATQVHFVPIEFLGWSCLTVGALGWGQIQIANANNITINPQYSRKQWMLEFCDVMLSFYPREIAKIGERMIRFEKVREFWLNKLEEIG
jgi:hypothetical protein